MTVSSPRSSEPRGCQVPGTIALVDGTATVKMTTPIMGDVWTAINGCKFAIADCTGRNPNVFYELGIAHTLGKPVVLMTQNMDDVPFDLQQFRVIVYEFTPRGMKALEMQLERTIASILDPVGTLLSDLALDSAKAFVEPDKEH